MAEQLMHENLDYEQMVAAEMARTSLSRAELDAKWTEQQADSEAELERLLAEADTTS